MVNREFAEWRCRIYDKLCFITNDEWFWKSRNLRQVIDARDSLLYDSSRVDKIFKGLKDNDEELALRCLNFIVRTMRFLNIPIENWKYGLRKYREKRCIYNYVYTSTSIIIIGYQPSGSIEVNIYDIDSYAGQLLKKHLPLIDKSKYFEDSLWKDNIQIHEYPSCLNNDEPIRIVNIKLKYAENQC